MDLVKMKEVAKQVFSIACRNTSNQSRAQAVAALFNACDEVGISGAEKRFAAEYGLSCFGYGGGL